MAKLIKKCLRGTYILDRASVPGMAPATTNVSILVNPRLDRTVKLATLIAKLNGRNYFTLKDIEVAEALLDSLEQAPDKLYGDEHFDPYTGERTYTKAEYDAMRAKGAGLIFNGLMFGFDPKGMIGFTALNNAPKAFGSNLTATEYADKELGINPVVSSLALYGIGRKGFNTGLNQARGIKNANLNLIPQENPLHNRFKLGDVEINDPNLYYRQGNETLLENVNRGGNNHTMFMKGNLWYGIPTEQMLSPKPIVVNGLNFSKPNSLVPKTHLLIANRNVPMDGATQRFSRIPIGIKTSMEKPNISPQSPEWLNSEIYKLGHIEPTATTKAISGGSRRVPIEGTLNWNNTKAYEFLPNYGYKQVYPPIEPIPNALDLYNLNGFNTISSEPTLFGLTLSYGWGRLPLKLISSVTTENSFNYGELYPFSKEKILPLFKIAKLEVIDFLNTDVFNQTQQHNYNLAKRLGLSIDNISGAERASHVLLPIRVTTTYNPKSNVLAQISTQGWKEPENDLLTFNSGHMWSDYLAKRASKHELLHRAYYGRPISGYNAFDNLKFYNYKNRKLFKPEALTDDFYEGYFKYAADGEAATNLFDLANDLNIKIGLEYPGKDALELMLKGYKGNKEFVVDALDLSTTPHYKRVWDALTGRYFMAPVTFGAGLSLLNK